MTFLQQFYIGTGYLWYIISAIAIGAAIWLWVHPKNDQSEYVSIGLFLFGLIMPLISYRANNLVRKDPKRAERLAVWDLFRLIVQFR